MRDLKSKIADVNTTISTTTFNWTIEIVRLDRNIGCNYILSIANRLYLIPPSINLWLIWFLFQCLGTAHTSWLRCSPWLHTWMWHSHVWLLCAAGCTYRGARNPNGSDSVHTGQCGVAPGIGFQFHVCKDYYHATFQVPGVPLNLDSKILMVRPWHWATCWMWAQWFCCGHWYHKKCAVSGPLQPVYNPCSLQQQYS